MTHWTVEVWRQMSRHFTSLGSRGTHGLVSLTSRNQQVVVKTVHFSQRGEGSYSNESYYSSHFTKKKKNPPHNNSVLIVCRFHREKCQTTEDCFCVSTLLVTSGPYHVATEGLQGVTTGNRQLRTGVGSGIFGYWTKNKDTKRSYSIFTFTRNTSRDGH